MAVSKSFVETSFCCKFIEIIIAAKAMAAPLCCERNSAALAGIEVIVSVIKYMGEGKAVRGSKVIHDSFVPVRIMIISYIVLSQIFVHNFSSFEAVMIIIRFFGTFEIEVVRSVFVGNMTPCQIPAFSAFIIFCYFVPVGIIVIVFINTVEYGCTQRVSVIIDPGSGIGKSIVLAIACTAEFPMQIDLIASTSEIGIAQFNNTYCAISIRITGTYSYDTCFLFNDIDFNDDIMFIGLSPAAKHEP